MMVGLQGSGKTTTTAKIAKRLTEQGKRKVLMASLDMRRPAAMEQLAVLGQQVGVDTLPIVAGQTPPQIARRALEAGRLGGYDVVMLDTAGRTTLDEAMMAEAAEVKRAANPHEVLLVADALTGQDAVNLARSFDERVGLTGIVLTRVDGDGRGGAALSMRAVTGKPIKLIGTGEKHGCAGGFPSLAHRRPHPRHGRHRLAGREGRGRRSTPRRPRASPRRCARARSISPICAISSCRCRRWAAWRPDGHAARHRQDEEPDSPAPTSTRSVLKRQMAIIDSMTPKERRNPDILKASRKRRIAAGSGTKAEDINKLLKMHRGMADMMKAMGGAKRGPMAGLAQMMGFGGGMPSPEADGRSSPRRCRAACRGMPGAPDCRRGMPGLPPKFPRRSARSSAVRKCPGLGGFPGLGKKK